MKNLSGYISLLKASPRTTFLLVASLILVLVFFILAFLSLEGALSQQEPQTTTFTQEEKLQNEADGAYSQVIQRSQELYPWTEHLPPKNSKYFVAFDEKEKAFFVSLYTKNNPSLTENYKQQLYLDLQRIGVATQSYKFNFVLR